MNSGLVNWFRKGWAFFFKPIPGFFDICFAGSLVINFINDKKIFFVFYTIFLVCLTFAKRERQIYKSLPLCLLAIWGLFLIFIHSYEVSPHSITFFYLNVYLMFEGFIYLFFGTLFLITFVRYIKNLNFFYLFIPVIILPWLREIYNVKRLKYTPLFACLISSFIYYLLKKKYFKSLIISSSGLILLFVNLHQIKLYFSTRVLMTKALLQDIVTHPFIGTGFNKTLSPDNMKFIIDERNGWLYRYNDILSIGAYLGLPAMLLVCWFIVKTFETLNFNYRFLFLAIILICLFQMTMFSVDKAVSFLLLTGLGITQSKRRKIWESIQR